MVADPYSKPYHPSTFVSGLTSHTCALGKSEADALEALLRERSYLFRAVPHARFAAMKESDSVNVVYYQSGKLTVQGKGTEDFIRFILEPEILKKATLGYEEILNPDLLKPRIGIDESGKGDFFGPLCVAGVYVNETVLKSWQGAGVRDSKRVTSDAQIARLDELIRKTAGCVVEVVTIGNPAYNRLYEKMKSVNKVLAWGHARVLENLLRDRRRMVPPPERAISDQFSSDKGTLERALMGLGRGVEFVQHHKAESDLAVAAASIVARHAFVSKLKALGERFSVELPKGGGAQADVAAALFVENVGAEKLGEVSKLHFRNAFRALGKPEPERRPWQPQRDRGAG
jgi:ribonuclease HIII